MTFDASTNLTPIGIVAVIVVLAAVRVLWVALRDGDRAEEDRRVSPKTLHRVRQMPHDRADG